MGWLPSAEVLLDVNLNVLDCLGMVLPVWEGLSDSSFVWRLD